MAYRPQLTTDADLADYRYNILHNVASEDAQAREVLSVFHAWSLNASYDDIYHKAQANKLTEILYKWGFDFTVEGFRELLRKCKYPKRR